jgi:hypothetical protein
LYLSIELAFVNAYDRLLSSVAVITDIHGNLPALDAALARVDEIVPGATYCGGDLVGYGPCEELALQA